jgi:sulfur relay (sulfurtransferase) DsrF/TusC family protein
MQVLHIVDQAYRATIEEQDDPVLWFAQVLRGANAEIALLLRGSAVNYLVFRQDASGLVFGAWRQTQPPRVAAAIVALLSKGTPVHVVQEDLAERGIRANDCVAGVQPIARARLGELVERFDRVWQW